jgi:hypothetical protein
MDIRSAKAVLRIQKCLKMGLRQIADVDLSAKNIDPDSVEYDIGMTVPSGALEIAHIEVAKAKAELGSLYQGLNIADQYIWSNVLGLTDAEIDILNDLQAATAGAQPTGAEVPLSPEPAAGGEKLAPEPAEQGAEKPAPTGGLEASKYRRIPKDKQIMESRHMEIVDRILQTDKTVQHRISELKHLVTDIRQALPKRR